MTRRRLLLALGTVLAMLGCWAVARHYTRPAFTEETACRIHPGMTEAEVLAVMKCPPGDYTGGKGTWIGSGPWTFWINPKGSDGWPNGAVYKGWIGHEGAVGVKFGPDGKVVRSWSEDVGFPYSLSFWDEILATVRHLFR